MNARTRRLLARACAIAALAALVAIAAIHASNRRLLDRTYPVQPTAVAAARGADAVARGRHLADITGCTDCHGADLRGRTFIDDGWWRGRYFASNLTLKAQAYSDDDLARVVRDGVRPDGRGVVQMPAFGYVRLSDAELADIVSFIRSLPAGGRVQDPHHIGPLDQWDLWRGQTFRPAVSYVAAERAKEPPSLGAEHERARHLVGIVCAECHGGDLTGNGWQTGAPDLAIAAAYSREQLTRLLRAGIGADGKPKGLMTRVARDRLHHLDDQEIGAIHAYLRARAAGIRR